MEGCRVSPPGTPTRLDLPAYRALKGSRQCQPADPGSVTVGEVQQELLHAHRSQLGPQAPGTRALGGRVHPLRRRVIAPSETRIRTLVHAVSAEVLDEFLGGWLRDLADAGRLDGLLTAIAIDGKWLRRVADGQVKLFAAMLQEEKVIIGQHRVPDETTETTQVKELLDGVDLRNAVVTADAVHAQRETAQDIAGPEEEDGRQRITSCSSRETSPPCRERPPTRSRQAAPAPLTGRNRTGPPAGPSAARSGSPMPRASTFRRPGRSHGSGATTTTATGS